MAAKLEKKKAEMMVYLKAEQRVLRWAESLVVCLVLSLGELMAEMKASLKAGLKVWK